ncbi:MAG: citrate lyase subunit beta / citryl-CoA lyase [Thermoanaerobacteraceae bacterium]|nr:citrate lyase subunit beta / citryl-CoA lyase [Thermoanaerobacteraceae bacterium]MDN5302245.1 citrate lyase subunit beta / citryl-CoA lyase [Thermoanaerobacteraceae bacterium]MDN5312158.1 citrate lyase subunit beta / citryl-CoA lyase [Thermoanaerobacteraceae bacterium]RKL62801.1 citrate lyase subunit beta [Thermoanaerobacteraceae bacterium SP2]
MKLRRTLLYVPGNNPNMIQDSMIYGADTILIDLEDSVSVYEKDAARYLVKYALRTLDFGKSEVAVRINGMDTPYWRHDISMIIPERPDMIRLPKAESAGDVKTLDAAISDLEAASGIKVGTTKIMVSIESARGLKNAYDIAVASRRMVAIAIGGEDFTADLGVKKTREGNELLVARGELVLAARAAGVDAIDSVFSDVNDEVGFRMETEKAKAMGFTGKSVINPRQIPIVHDVFKPTCEEIEEALKIKEAIKEAESRGSGVISLNGKMVDKPIVKRAERTLELAEMLGLIKEVAAC